MKLKFLIFCCLTTSALSQEIKVKIRQKTFEVKQNIEKSKMYLSRISDDTTIAFMMFLWPAWTTFKNFKADIEIPLNPKIEGKAEFLENLAVLDTAYSKMADGMIEAQKTHSSIVKENLKRVHEILIEFQDYFDTVVDDPVEKLGDNYEEASKSLEMKNSEYETKILPYSTKIKESIKIALADSKKSIDAYREVFEKFATESKKIKIDEDIKLKVHETIDKYAEEFDGIATSFLSSFPVENAWNFEFNRHLYHNFSSTV